jgi:hypothetical protein
MAVTKISALDLFDCADTSERYDSSSAASFARARYKTSSIMSSSSPAIFDIGLAFRGCNLSLCKLFWQVHPTRKAGAGYRKLASSSVALNLET